VCPFPSFPILISCRLPPSDSLFPTVAAGDLGFDEVRCFCFLLLVNLRCLLPTVCLDLFAARDFGNVNSVVAVGLGVAMDLVACRGCGCGFGEAWPVDGGAWLWIWSRQGLWLWIWLRHGQRPGVRGA